MNPKQQAALNNLLKTVAAFLLTLVEEPEADKKPESGGESGGAGATDIGDMLDGDDAKAKEQLKKELEAEEKAKKEAADKKKADDKAKKEQEAKAKKEKEAADKAEKEKKPEEPKPAEETKPTPTNPDALLADARAAAIAYAGKHGREALRTLLNEYTKGTIAEIEKGKLPELIQKLRA